MQIFLTIITALTTGGVLSFVQFLINRSDKKKENSTNTCLIMQERHEQAFKDMEKRIDNLTAICTGLAYDRIIHVGERYLERGYISIDEREDFRKYLWSPYHNAGGNGSGDAMMKAIDDLPIRKETKK